MPNITPDKETGIGDWKREDIAELSKSGTKPDLDNAQGLMYEVIQGVGHGYKDMTKEDALAIADYLKNDPADQEQGQVGLTHATTLIPRHFFDDLAKHLVGADVLGFGLKVEDEPMAQRRENNFLDVFVAHMNPALGEGVAFRAEDDRLGAARARAKPDVLLDQGLRLTARFALPGQWRGLIEPRNLRSAARSSLGAVNIYRVDRFATLIRQQIFGRIAAFYARRPLEYFSQFCGRRRRHQELKEEPIELRLRQRVGALELDRILRGKHDEGRGENTRLAEYRDLLFFHRFEHCRLGFRRGSVDLVGENDMSEDRALLELKFPPAVGVRQHFGADDIRWHQVGSELNPFE